MGPEVLTVAALAARVPDGAKVAIPPDYSGCAMAAVRELMRRRVKRLHLVAVPQGGFQADMLVGAGCVATMEAAAVTLGEYGPPGRFVETVKEGAITIRDSTCPAIHAGLQAAEKGVPFMPLRGILGSDLVTYRDDWAVIDNPLADGPDPILILPAIVPDIALFHAARADRHGNVWFGVRRELMVMAHAARSTLATVERIEDRDFLADEALAAGTIPALYVSAIAEVPQGAWPVGLAGAYPPDRKALAAYAAASRSREGFQAWLNDALAVEPA
jgi:glutaconate CoA-transferase, subunit A